MNHSYGHQTVTRTQRQQSSMLPPAGGTKKNRLTAAPLARRGVRGELLTNGYQSLRAQGMLGAVKVDQRGTEMAAHSKELEHVNICIEQTYADPN